MNIPSGSLPGRTRPNLSFRLLGQLSVDGLPHASWTALLAQRKRLALLLYLLLGSQGGVVERQTLLALFWPEMDEDRSRQALRRSLHFLRRALGGEAIVGLGRHALEVNWKRVGCDLLELRIAVTEGRPMRVLEVYGGELLPGFHVGGMPAFDRWMEAERSRARSAAYDAAMSLAREALTSNKAEAALSWSQRAEGIMPAREEAARLSMAMLHQLGNGAAAIRKYEALERALGADFDMQPAPQTQRLIAAVRGGRAPAMEAAPGHASAAAFSGTSLELLHFLPGAVLQADLRGRVRYANGAAAELLRTPVADLLGRRVLDLVRDDYRERVQELLTTQLLDRQEVTTAEFPLDGENDRWVEGRTRLLNQEWTGGGGTLSLYTDITERKQAERAQRRSASRDPLTGLPDRGGFELILEDRLRQAMRTGDEVTLFHVALADTGHGGRARCTSDACQLQAARLLRDTFRDADVVARIDEGTFAAVAVAPSGQVERPVRTRLQRRLQTMEGAGDWPAGVTLELGVVRRSAHSRGLTELVVGDAPIALLDEPLWEILRQAAEPLAFSSPPP